MKPILPLALLGAILLAGCDTGTQASTSSETQTALQELADNAQGLVSLTPGQLSAATSASAARMLDTNAALDTETMTTDCSGQPWWSFYDGTGGRYIDGYSYDPGTGPDGTPSTCSYRESHEHRETFYLDSVMRLRTDGTWSQFYNWSLQIAEGSATYDFRTGASFEIPHFRRARSLTSNGAIDTLVETIVINRNCQVVLTGISIPYQLTEPSADAPVVCGGSVVGQFSWNQISPPVVTDLSGRTIAPRFHPPVSFPEDSLGLRARIIDTKLDPVDSTAVILAIFSLKLLPEDTARPSDSIHFCAAPGSIPGSRACNAWLASSTFGHPGDTLAFHLSYSALKELQGDTGVYEGAAWGGFFEFEFDSEFDLGGFHNAQSAKLPLPQF